MRRPWGGDWCARQKCILAAEGTVQGRSDGPGLQVKPSVPEVSGKLPEAITWFVEASMASAIGCYMCIHDYSSICLLRHPFLKTLKVEGYNLCFATGQIASHGLLQPGVYTTWGEDPRSGGWPEILHRISPDPRRSCGLQRRHWDLSDLLVWNSRWASQKKGI